MDRVKKSSVPSSTPASLFLENAGTKRARNSHESLDTTFRWDDTVLERVIPYIKDHETRAAVSLTSRQFYALEVESRKNICVLCDTASVEKVKNRYSKGKELDTLTLRGKPKHWFREILDYGDDDASRAYPWVIEMKMFFQNLKIVVVQRLWIDNFGIEVIAKARGNMLEELQILDCKGPLTTESLQTVALNCEKLKILSLAKSSDIIDVEGVRWVLELAVRCKSLQTLNFSGTLLHVTSEDLVLLAANCPLSSLGVNGIHIETLVLFFLTAAKKLKEFRGGLFTLLADIEEYILAMEHLRFGEIEFMSLGLWGIGADGRNYILEVAPQNLTELDISKSFITDGDHQTIVSKFTNLEVLKVSNNIGDHGLKAVANHCQKLRILCVRGEGNKQRMVTSVGITQVAQKCRGLERLRLELVEISNNALRCIGENCGKLVEFHLELISNNEICWEESLDDEILVGFMGMGSHLPAHTPLDEGFTSLVICCTRLEVLILRLGPNYLSEEAFRIIGSRANALRSIELKVEITEESLGHLIRNNNIQKLEINGADVGDAFLLDVPSRLGRSYRYLWIDGCQITRTYIREHPVSWRVSQKLARTIPHKWGDIDCKAQFAAYKTLKLS